MEDENLGLIEFRNSNKTNLMGSTLATSTLLASGRSEAARLGSPREWIECGDCGMVQELPAPLHGHCRYCRRCHGSLGRGRRALGAVLPLSLTALILFAVAESYPLIGIELDRITRATGIGSGIVELFEHGLSPVALFLLLLANVAPLFRLLANAYVLAQLRLGRRPSHLATLFRLSERLRPWAMVDVLFLATLVAIAKLEDFTAVDIGTGCWSLGLLVLTLAALDSAIDRDAVWAGLRPSPAPARRPDPSTSISCRVCGLIQPTHGVSEHPEKCLRCNARLSRRKPESVSRSWALVVTGALLYIPANVYPALTVVSFGQGTPSTIIEGVMAVMNGEDWPLAVVIFAASIAVPLLKLLGLAWLLVSVQFGLRRRLLDRTRLYRLIRFVGRWSAVDVFVTALLSALVTMGRVATIEPGSGILAFGGVVLATMFATETFDPRLMWDAAGIGDD